MTAFDLSALAKKLGGEYKNGTANIPGPNHSGDDRSLSVKLAADNPDGFIVHSFADDDPLVCRDYVRRELGLGEFKPNPSGSEKRFTYEFRHSSNGNVAYKKVRIENGPSKTFFFEPKGRGGNQPILYGSERLHGADKGSIVLIVEGEKKVDALKERGWLAVSADSGAKSNWDKIDVSHLDGFKIVIWPDSDDAGEIYATKAAARIRDALKSDVSFVRPFPSSGRSKGKDVCDFTGNNEELTSLIHSAAAHSAEPVKSRFKLTAFKDFKYNPNTEWVVKRVIPSSGLTVLFGKKSTYKSFVALDLAMHIAAGVPWAGRKVSQGAVIYIAAEGEEGIHKRGIGYRQYWRVEYGSVIDDAPLYLIGDSPNLGSDRGDVEEIVASVQALGISKPALVIIDTLAQTLFGADENGAGMNLFIANAQKLSRSLNCAVMAVHHVGHGDDSRPRGNSSLGGAEYAEIRAEAGSDKFVTYLEIGKLKDEADKERFKASLVRHVLGKDEEGEETSTLVVREVSVTKDKPTKKDKEADAPRVGKNQRLLFQTIADATKTSGVDLGDGRIGVDDEIVRGLFYEAHAEKAKPDESHEKLQERQRRGFSTAIAAMLNANIITAHKEQTIRYLILPNGKTGNSGKSYKTSFPRIPACSPFEARKSGNNSRKFPKIPADEDASDGYFFVGNEKTQASTAEPNRTGGSDG
jgi:hypothetical protein